MTDYIESYATRPVLPPWRADSARTWAFVLPLQKGRVRKYLNYYFNTTYGEPAPFYYSPLAGDDHYALLMVSDCSVNEESARAKNASAPGGWHHLSHREVFVAIPVMRHKISANNLLTEDPRVVWIQPFACSNSATVVFSAREVWGASMTVAGIEIDPRVGPHRAHIDATYMGPKVFEPRAKSATLPFLHITTDGLRPGDWTNIGLEKPYLSESFKAIAPVPGNENFEFEVNHLKQFRDIHNFELATYRAIVSKQAIYPNIRDFSILDERNVEIFFMKTPGMRDLLEYGFGTAQSKGPPPGHAVIGARRDGDLDWDLPRLQMRPELAYSFTSDIEFKVNKTLYAYQGRLAG